jgi:hypothetical protein
MPLAAIGCKGILNRKGILKSKYYGFSYPTNRIAFLDRPYLPDSGLPARKIRVEANLEYG